MSIPLNPAGKEPIYDGKTNLNTESLNAGLKKIKLRQIKQLGANFRDNLELVESMVFLPHLLLAMEDYKRSLVPYEIQAALKSRLQKMKFSEARKEVFESNVLPERESKIYESIDRSEQTFSAILQDNWGGLRDTYETLLFSAAVWIWCIFEILTKELWEVSLNYAGSDLSKNVLSKLSKLERLSNVDLLRGRYISLDYLAKHGYNISNILGTALSSKFDFTCLNGIKEAYTSAFPKSANIRDALQNKGIIALEATRHVVVHNAGVIDEDYCNKTNTNKSQIGERLQLDTRKLADYANSSIDVVLCLMTSVSSILSNTKRLNQ